MTRGNEQPYISKSGEPCPATIQLDSGTSICCDLDAQHIRAHRSEVRDFKGKVFIITWEVKRGEN